MSVVYIHAIRAITEPPGSKDEQRRGIMNFHSRFRAPSDISDSKTARSLKVLIFVSHGFPESVVVAKY